MCTSCNHTPSLHPSTSISLYQSDSFALHYAQDKAALFRAAGAGDVAAVRRLLDAHVDINSTDEVCIMYIMCAGCIRLHCDGHSGHIHSTFSIHLLSLLAGSLIYSGTPVNRHPSMADTHDITDNSESPDHYFNTLETPE